MRAFVRSLVVLALAAASASACDAGGSQPSGTTTVVPEPGKPIGTTPGPPLTREEIERRERMLEGTYLPGPTPTTGPGAPVEGPKKGTETLPPSGK